MVTENIKFYTIPVRDFDDLLGSGSFTIDDNTFTSGLLTVAHTHPPMGIGTFKTVHRGWLTLSPLPTSSLVSAPNQLIVAK